MGWPHNRENFSLCTCKMTRNTMHIWRESMYLLLGRHSLRVWFETQCVFHQMDTPLHKSYVHYQHQAMVPWEREKNPLCIQNCFRSNLLQSPCKKQKQQFRVENSQIRPFWCKPKYYILSFDQGAISHWLWCAVKNFWILDPKLPCLPTATTDLIHLCDMGSRKPPCIRENHRFKTNLLSHACTHTPLLCSDTTWSAQVKYVRCVCYGKRDRDRVLADSYTQLCVGLGLSPLLSMYSHEWLVLVSGRP